MIIDKYPFLWRNEPKYVFEDGSVTLTTSDRRISGNEPTTASGRTTLMRFLPG